MNTILNHIYGFIYLFTIVDLIASFKNKRQLKTPFDIYHYANHVIKKRYIKGEPIILTNVDYSYHYTIHVLKERWIDAEPIILTDPFYSFCYAKNIIKGRWYEAEPIIKTSSIISFDYANEIIKGRWYEAELCILYIIYLI